MAETGSRGPQEIPQDLLLLGADGSPGGWTVALQLSGGTELRHWSSAQVVAAGAVAGLRAAVVDMPLGLLDEGPRRCDLEARRLLGRPRQASVFPAPARPMLEAASYADAQRIRRRLEGRGCSRQAFGILARVRELDRLLAGEALERFHEGHPELIFRALGEGDPPAHSKHTPEGRRERWQLLLPHFPELRGLDPAPARAHDPLDAYACLWTARRVGEGRAAFVPLRDQRAPGRRQPLRIWF